MDFTKFKDIIIEIEDKFKSGNWGGFNTDYGVKTYYADYVKAGFKYKPKKILEIGVRFGYSGMAMVYGSSLAEVKDIEFIGIDDEGYHPGSNDVAKKLFQDWFPDCKCTFHKINTVFNGFPHEVNDQTYDMINVDANHSVEGAFGDMTRSWKLLKPGGVMIVDDCTFEDVGKAIEGFSADNIKESFVVMNERGQRYYIKNA